MTLQAVELDNVTPLTPEGFTQWQLHDAFAMIENKEHWKGRIDAVISEWLLPIARAACEFYTATELMAEPAGEGKVRVTSPGYWEGPAGP